MNSSSKLKMVLSRLTGLRRLDNTYIAQCPLKKEHKVMVADLGERVMVRCHKGCNQDRLLESLNLVWFDLYESKYDTAKDKQWLRKFRARQMTSAKTHPLSIKEANRLFTRISLYG